MGVMGCFRGGCNSVLCDTYIQSVGYVCRDCQGEFEEFLEKKGLNPKTKKEIEKYLKVFMETDKGDFSSQEDNEMSVSEFFRKNTPD